MLTPTPDDRQIIPMEHLAILRLVSHENGALDESFPRRQSMYAEPQGRTWPAATPMREVTGAECYGCVDWFHY